MRRFYLAVFMVASVLGATSPARADDKATVEGSTSYFAQLALATTDFAMKNCPAVAVNYENLDALVAKAGHLHFDARGMDVYRKFASDIEGLVPKHGMDAVCYELQTMFLQQQKEPLLTRMMYRK